MVLDASAALAFIQDEPGRDVVADALHSGATIGAVSLAEVHSTLMAQGVLSEPVVRRLTSIGLDVAQFDESDALAVGALRVPTARLGLSLADRAFLALALRLGRPALSADRALAEADVGVEVVLIR